MKIGNYDFTLISRIGFGLMAVMIIGYLIAKAYPDSLFMYFEQTRVFAPFFILGYLMGMYGVQKLR